jgi:pimeloyl-ACP methyl ester carboxylesterase
MDAAATGMNFVLIHGAWHGGWCWSKVVVELEALGHSAVAPDLPGSGDDKTPPGGVTLADYANRIATVLDAQPGPSILVGHSMGGMAISAAAELRPQRIRRLVYLCAFLPRNGESLLMLEERNADPRVPPNVIPDKEHFTATINPNSVVELFYHDCAAQDAAFARSRLRPQAFLPLTAQVALSGNRFGRVPRSYIECTEDRAIVIDFQRLMQRASPCDSVVTLATSHSPFLSAPKLLAETLSKLDQKPAPLTGQRRKS